MTISEWNFHYDAAVINKLSTSMWVDIEIMFTKEGLSKHHIQKAHHSVFDVFNDFLWVDQLSQLAVLTCSDLQWNCALGDRVSFV